MDSLVSYQYCNIAFSHKPQFIHSDNIEIVYNASSGSSLSPRNQIRSSTSHEYKNSPRLMFYRYGCLKTGFCIVLVQYGVSMVWRSMLLNSTLLWKNDIQIRNAFNK